MSAIDFAFIRAYTLESTAALESPTSEILDRAIPAAAQRTSDRGREELRNVAATARTARPAVAVPLAAANGAKSRPANLASPPRRATARSQVRSVQSAVLTPHGAADSIIPAPHFRLTSFIHSTTTLEPAPIAEVSVAGESAERVAPVEKRDRFGFEPQVDQPAAAAIRPVLEPNSPPTISMPPATAAALPADADAPRAAFEVDHFVWPELCESLLAKQAGEFDQLVGQLAAESGLGRKTIAITGSRRGDGRTTLALVLAWRLAATAAKVVLVDADFDAPQLAARLGMTIESGWERVLAEGLPVWDGLIESLGDRVTLLPLAPRPASIIAQPSAVEFVAQHSASIRQHLGALREHFDVVLVDAGAIKAVRPDAKPRGPLALADSLDAAIMVSDARIVAPGRVAELQRRLQESRIVPLGVAENFCQPASA